MSTQLNEDIRIWPPPLSTSNAAAATAKSFELDATGLATIATLGGFPGNRIYVPFVSQEPMALWCWVACTKMIVNSFGIAARLGEIAERHLSHLGLSLDCSPPGIDTQCDHEAQPRNIPFIFDDWGLVVDPLSRPLTFPEIRDEIDAGRPILVAVFWIENGERQGGHVVVIRGWRVVNGQQLVYVNDPLRSRAGEVPYEDLLEEYGPDNDGEWQLTWTGFRR